MYTFITENMKAKYRLKKTGDNEYTRLTGKRAYTLNGGSNCVVSVYKNGEIKGYSSQSYAYYLFELKPLELAFNPQIKVSSLCGATNCVNRVHLIAEYKPTKENQDYIKTYLRIDDVESLAHTLNISISLLQKYFDTQK